MESKMNYMIRVFREASFSKLSRILNEAHRRSGKSKAYLFMDMVNCTLRYGTGYHDYIVFEFWNIKHDKRDTYLTRMRSKKFVLQMNDRNYAHIFDNKNEFDEVFKDFLKRDYVDALNAPKEEFIEYYNTHERTFAKMLDLTCGHGAEIINMSDFATGEDFYNYVKEKGFAVLEDVLENHPDIKAVYPCALNTMRMITLIGDDGKPRLLFAAHKFGNEGRFVDVYGLHGPVDLETGTIKFPFHSGDTTSDILYTKHPYTGHQIVGFKVPFFKEAKEMILEAAMRVPQMRYIGWDVAITPNGPVIIEGNDYTAYDYWQLPSQNPDKIGILPTLKEIVPSFKY